MPARRCATSRRERRSTCPGEARAISHALITPGAIGDFRPPGLLRTGFPPLHTSHADVFDAVPALRAVMDEREWNRSGHRVRGQVT